jgi:hypothetical protein
MDDPTAWVDMQFEHYEANVMTPEGYAVTLEDLGIDPDFEELAYEEWRRERHARRGWRRIMPRRSSLLKRQRPLAGPRAFNACQTCTCDAVATRSISNSSQRLTISYSAPVSVGGFSAGALPNPQSGSMGSMT